MSEEKRIEAARPRLEALARRVVPDGDRALAEDAVQEAMARFWALGAAGRGAIGSPEAWLATVATRIAIDMRRRRRPQDDAPPEALDALETADPGPEEEAALADALGAAMGRVMEVLSADERVAFILHDSFGFAFADVAAFLGKSEAAARQAASRARRRLRQGDEGNDGTGDGSADGVADGEGAAQVKDRAKDRAKERAGAAAFLAAARSGDLAGLLELLHPEVRFVDADGTELRGARAVADLVLPYRARAAVRVGAALEVRADGALPFTLRFAWQDGRICEIRRVLIAP